MLYEPMALKKVFRGPSGIAGDRLESDPQTGSHRILSRPGWEDFVFAFHEREEIGPRMLARIAKKTGLKPKNL